MTDALDIRASRPDSDPRELRRQMVDARFQQVEKRVDKHEGRIDRQDEKLDNLALELAKQGASIKAWLAAATLFLALFSVALRLWGK